MAALTGVARLYLVVVNIIFGLFGISVFMFGLFLRFGSRYYDDQIEAVKTSLERSATDSGQGSLDLDQFDVAEVMVTTSIGFIVFGLFVAGVSVLGFLGGCCGQKSALLGYVVVCLLLLSVQAVIAGVVYGVPDTVQKPSKDRLKADIKTGYGGLLAADVISVAWNVAMQKLECCGVDSYADFTGASKWDATTYSLVTPIACCRILPTSADLACATTPTSTNNYMNEGCYDTVWDMTLGHQTVGIVCGCVGLFQILIIVAGVYILCTLNDKKTDTADELPKKSNNTRNTITF